MYPVFFPRIHVIQCMLGGCGLGGTCDHIKAFGLSPCPYQDKGEHWYYQEALHVHVPRFLYCNIVLLKLIHNQVLHMMYTCTQNLCMCGSLYACTSMCILDLQDSNPSREQPIYPSSILSPINRSPPPTSSFLTPPHGARPALVTPASTSPCQRADWSQARGSK